MTLPLLAEHYVHDLSPFVPFLQFGDNFGVRWYGLAYVAGFLVAWWLMRWLVRKGCCELREEQVADFITFAAILGVMVGGRLGYMLFYATERFFSNPLTFFHILDGGMSSHGGILGLVIFTWVYARRAKISWPGLGDNLVTVAPVGIFFGRIANFINGELYGHKTDVSWGVKFPGELVDRGDTVEIARQCADAEPALAPAVDQIIREGTSAVYSRLTDLLSEAVRQSDKVREILAERLPARHPSQLYEAALEGLFLFVVLMVVRLRWKNLYHGMLTGLFFVLYAVVRILVENLRVPDASRIAGLTRGQFYSVFMVLIGAAFIAYALKTRRQNRLARDRTG